MTTPTTHHTPARTCDQLGVCQGHTHPCNGCTPAPRRSHRICNADMCRQGHKPCPCPQACEMPETTHAPQYSPAITKQGVFAAVLVVLAAMAAVSVILGNLASSA